MKLLVSVLALTSLSSSINAFSPTTTTTLRITSSSSRTNLYNVPPSTNTQDQESYSKIIDSSSRESPPQSFYQLQINCARATELAINAGHKLLEIEFPPLPASVLEMDDVSAYDVAEANLRLAIEFAKNMASKKQQDSEGSSSISTLPKKIAILVPDEAELNILSESIGNNRTPHPGVVVSSLRRSDPNDDRMFKPEQVFMNLFGQKSGVIKPMDGVDMYIILVASAQELPDVEELFDLEEGKKIICFYNLKLDILRGDLGAPAFPPKDFQDRFLSKVKPVYYLRTRQYSRSTPQPPFLVNYQGCLFRSFPGQYQTLLDTGNGKYRRVCGNDVRPALGEFKEQLTKALQVEGIIQEESAALNFLRTGYKTTTWWEEERENASDSWKT
jgi:hypothetical protein